MAESRLPYTESVITLHKNSGIYLADVPSLWENTAAVPKKSACFSRQAGRDTDSYTRARDGFAQQMQHGAKVGEGETRNQEVLRHTASHLTRCPWIHPPRLSAVESGIWQRRLSLSSVSITSRTLRSSSKRWRALRLPMKGEVGDWQSNMPLE